jgi:Uma2 family endonuclease
MNAVREESYFTYEDYLTWPDYPRYELIDGDAYMLAAPTPQHQAILLGFGVQFHTFLKGKTCQAFVSPLDVILEKTPFGDTVVQPDLLVVCDKNKITKKGCEGVPDLVIEILSPSSGRMDNLIKFKRYQRAGIAEYWIVNPETGIVHCYVLQDGKYIASHYDQTEKISVHVLPECEIDLNDIFPPRVEIPPAKAPKTREP